MGTSVWDFQASTGGAVKSLEELEKRLNPIDNITKALLKRGGIAGATLGDSQKASATLKIVAQLNDELKTQQRSLAAVEAEMKSTASLTKYRELKTAADRYRDSLVSIKDELDETTGKTQNQNFGYHPSLFQPTQSASRALTAVGGFSNTSSQIAQAVNDLGDLGDNTQTLSNDLKELKTNFGSVVGSLKDVGGAIGSIISGASSLKTGVGSIISTIGPFNIAAAGVVGALALVGVGLSLVEEDATRAADALQRSVEAVGEDARRKQEVADLLKHGDLDEAQTRLEAAEHARQIALDQIAIAQKTLDEVNRRYQALGSNFNPLLRKDLADQGANAQSTISKLTSGDLGTAVQDILALTGAIAQIKAAKDAKDALDRLNQAESDLTATRLQAKSAADQFQKQVQEFESNAAYEALKSRRDQDRQDSLADDQHNREVGKILLDGQKSIRTIYTDYAKTILTDLRDYGRAEVAAYKQLNKSLNQTETEYQKSSAKLSLQHNKEKLKSDAAYDKEALRRRQDLNDSLLDAELSNDSIAYLRLQRDAAKENTRQAEDRQQQLSDDQEAYQQQKDDLLEAKNDQREQLLTSYADEKQDRLEALQLQMSDERVALAERLAEQRTNNAQALKDSQDAYDLQQQLQEQQREWQDQDQAEANQRTLTSMRKAFDDQMREQQTHDDELMGIIRSGGKDQLKTVEYGQLQIVSAYAITADRIVAGIQSKMAGLSYGNGSTSSYYGGSSGNQYGAGDYDLSNLGALSGYGGGVTSGGMWADNGGIFTKPTLTLLGERRSEAVIPLKPSGGLPDGMGGQHYHFNFDTINVGSDVSRELLQSQLQLFGVTVVRALRDARSGTPYQG